MAENFYKIWVVGSERDINNIWQDRFFLDFRDAMACCQTLNDDFTGCGLFHVYSGIMSFVVDENKRIIEPEKPVTTITVSTFIPGNQKPEVNAHGLEVK